MRIFPFKILTFLLLLHVFCLGMASANNNVLPYRFQYFTTEEGLPQNTVDDILMDSQGFMWFATWNGLCRFDGYEFYTYRPDKTEVGLPSHFVYTLAENQQSQLWIGTLEGVVIYNLITQRFEQLIIDGFDHTQHAIRHIFCDNNKIWLATGNGGVVLIQQLENNQFKLEYKITADNSVLNSNSVNLLFPVRENQLLIGTSNGAFLLDKSTGKIIENSSIEQATVNSNVLSAYISPQNELWIGQQFFLLRFDNNFNLKQTYSNIVSDESSLLHNTVNAIASDLDGNMIVGTLGGLCIYNEKNDNFTRIGAEQGNKHLLNNAFVNSLFCDAKGNVWIGTEKGGANKYNLFQKPFQSLTHDPVDDNSLSFPTINSVYKQGQMLWVGTAGGGVNLVDSKSGRVNRFQFNPYSENSINSNFITSIVSDQSGKLYFGSWGSGFNQKNADQQNYFKRFYHQPSNRNSLTNNFVSSMYTDPRGFILIGTEGGIDIFNPKDELFTHLTGSMAPIGISEVGSIELDHWGYYWIGTRNGLYRFAASKVESGKVTLNPNEISVFKVEAGNPNSIAGNYITTLREDSKGQMWAGTYGNGIIKIRTNNDGTFSIENFNQDHGLSNNVVYCIEESKNGLLWISTDHGLSAFDPVTKSFYNYFERDGLLNNQFYWSASFTDTDGVIYFGGINGLNYFDPIKMNEYPFDNKVIFTDFKVNSQSLKPLEIRHGKVVLQKPVFMTDDIRLSYRDNVFSIEFSAMDYFFPEKIGYTYMMEGVDNDWVTINSDRRFASYTNLNGGEYLFKVRCTNNDGTWSEHISTLRVVIVPPFWQTNWFRILIMVTIMMLVMGYIRWSTLGLIEQKRKLEKLVTERTKKIEEQKEILVEQSENLKSTNLILEQRQKLIEGQKAELENKNTEILAQRDQLIDLNEQVQQVNQFRLRFFTNISHEFRTPLTLIIDPIQSLLQRWKSDPATVETLRLIDRNAQRLLHLINQLMYFRRIEMGKIKIKATSGNMTAFLSDIFSSFTDLAQQQQIIYQFTADQSVTEAWFDKDKMENILYNLLSNAFKFTKPRGQIVLEVKYNAEPDGKMTCKILVSDTGVGIDKNDIELVFDRFYQVENRTNSSFKGSGVGLSLTRELVETIRGQIGIESELGKGTTFSVLIPCGKSDFTDQELSALEDDHGMQIDQQVTLLKDELLNSVAVNGEQSSDVKDRAKPLVLLVEDNFDLRNFLVHSFSDEYRVIEADNGKDGVDLAAKYTPDLIISDIMMPVMDGMELCSRIKTNIQTSHIPVILLTAKALTENWIDGLEVGADDYIPKPFNFVVLQARVKNMIESRKKLMRLFSKELCPDVERVTSNTLDEEFLQKTYQILDKYYVEPEFSVEDFAREMCVSKSLLYKKLKSLTGMSISDYVNSFKIKKSLPLLAEGRLNVADVAFKIGFNDPKYFSRVFRKFIGMTPSAYAESN